MGVPEWIRTALAILLGCLIALCVAIRHDAIRLGLGGMAALIAVALIVMELAPDDEG